MSGHIFFKHRYFGYDDALYTTGRVLEILASHDAPLSTLMSDVPVTHVTPEIRTDCPDDIKFDVVADCVAWFRKALEANNRGDLQPLELIDIDGVRVIFEGGWGLVRASNTQPVLVLRCEAQTPERLAQIRGLIDDVVSQAIASRR